MTPVDILVGHAQHAQRTGKRGPASKLQQHMERISQLPKPRQRVVMEVLESMLAQNR